MAEKGSSEKSLNDLEKEITCSLCQEHYKDPKLLMSCCHYYCKQCILDLAKKTGLDKPFPCPECRKDTTLPQGSVDNLQAAFFINCMKEVHSKLQQVTGKVEAKCEMCSSEDKAEAYCHQCAQFLCAECEKYHRRHFTGHKILTIDELKTEEIAFHEPPFQACKCHEQPMNIYCFKCSCLICRDCTIKDHYSHNYEFVKKAAVEIKEELDKHLQPLMKKADGIAIAVKEVKSAKTEIASQGESVRDSVKQSFDELRQILEAREKELLSEVTEKEARKLEHLSSQEKSLSTAHGVIQSVVEYTKQCIKHSTDDEMMVRQAEIMARLDTYTAEMEELLVRGDLLMYPVESADMEARVNCFKEMGELCRTKAVIGTKHSLVKLFEMAAANYCNS